MIIEKEYELFDPQGAVVFVGTNDQCFIKLLRSQSQSTSYALKTGWKIKPTGKEIESNYQDVKVINKHSDHLEVIYQGQVKTIGKNYIRGAINLLDPGDKVTVDTAYLR